jgi:hypothetical protein
MSGQSLLLKISKGDMVEFGKEAKEDLEKLHKEKSKEKRAELSNQFKNGIYNND